MPAVENLTEVDVRRRLNPVELVAALESAFRDRYPSITIPPRTLTRLANGIFLAMSCYDGSGHALGMKLVLLRDHAIECEQHYAPGTDGRCQATYLLLDPETAQPRLTISANYLTDLRTAATSALATKFLARPDASTLGIFGTGRLARAHIRVLPVVRQFKRVLICGGTSVRSAQFVQEVSNEIPTLTFAAAAARSCAAESDVLCTCTSSPVPLRWPRLAPRNTPESGGRISAAHPRSGHNHNSTRPLRHRNLRRPVRCRRASDPY
jgi:ornithine cyclodeaminase/alanine dehydrogenase-like protein (mu-crystallin family)